MAKFLSSRKKKKLSSDIHIKAYPAYDFFNSQAFLFDKPSLGIDTLNAIQFGQIFSATHPSPSKCYIFSGFEIPGFSIHQFDIHKHAVVIFDDLNDDEIELRAWTGVFRVLIASTRNNQLEPLRKSVNNSAPTSIIEHLFSSKKITQEYFAKCSRMTISGLKKQRELREQPLITSHTKGSLESEPTIFEQLKQATKYESQ
ncbi:hypothetical protein ACWU4D_10580 [Vibrio sp. WJH972]